MAKVMVQMMIQAGAGTVVDGTHAVEGTEAGVETGT